QAAWLLGFAQAAWLLGFAQAAWLLGFAQAAWLLGFAQKNPPQGGGFFCFRLAAKERRSALPASASYQSQKIIWLCWLA
ncbi:hypothetical protein, partial [uncultured Cardiobacterium sp.]|uniref:hypothetical protein n=1 Tax=uncultured Cardiobacterium sp. TaxID=417619 RepID=UPI00260EE055